MKRTELLTPEQARKMFPRVPCETTLWRWSRYGLANGIKLRSIAVGSRRYFRRQDIEAFLKACERLTLRRKSRA